MARDTLRELVAAAASAAGGRRRAGGGHAKSIARLESRRCGRAASGRRFGGAGLTAVPGAANIHRPIPRRQPFQPVIIAVAESAHNQFASQLHQVQSWLPKATVLAAWRSRRE